MERLHVHADLVCADAGGGVGDGRRDVADARARLARRLVSSSGRWRAGGGETGRGFRRFASCVYVLVSSVLGEGGVVLVGFVWVVCSSCGSGPGRLRACAPAGPGGRACFFCRI